MFEMFVCIFLALLIFAFGEEKFTTTTEGDICDLDNSCNSTVTVENVVELPAEKANVSKKWKYNITDGIIANETIDIFHINGTNLTNVEIDLLNKNKSLGNESKSTNTKYRVHLEERCACDLTRGGCDLNCCCDRDCLSVNRDIFKKCSKVDHSEENKMCLSKILNSPLLCVVKDNLYSRHFYPQHQIAHEASNVDKLLKNREIYGWPIPTIPQEEEKISHNYKQYEMNSDIWIFEKSENKPFRLPKSTMTSRDCSNKEVAKFMDEYEETCVYRIRNVSADECESNGSIFNSMTYFSNFTFIMNPNLLNYSADCRNNCVNATPFICESDNLATCVKANVSKIASNYISNTNTCSQAVTSVHYEIIHNGTEGILEVNVYLALTNIIFRPDLLWAITFKLTYQWVNQNEAFYLSGYPGYVLEKPVITGYKIFQNLKENKTYESLKISHNPKNWLTVFRTNSDGSCLKHHRENILFQENLFAHCWLPVPKINSVENCESFQNEILETIFGTRINLSNIYVSTYGDPDINDKRKWAPIIVNFPSAVMNETCYGIITSVKMVILHSVIGEHDDPQRVIMGLKVVGNSLYKNILKYNHVMVSFAVNFYDVTNPPLRIFAEPPTYEVKLPTDFFYPFFSSGRVLTETKTVLFVMICFLYNF